MEQKKNDGDREEETGNRNGVKETRCKKTRKAEKKKSGKRTAGEEEEE